jgi:WD40-like Beta Propeller Repeat
MRDDLASRLRSGSRDFAATVTPAAPDAIRARGSQRRRRRAITSAVLAMAIGAGGAGTAYTSFDRSSAGVPPTTRSSSAPASGAPWAGRPGIVAVTTRGALVLLNPLTGVASRILVAGGVAGDALSVSPDGSTVYFAARRGCADEIESVPVTGSRPALIAPGVLPAVSPDGKRLAFAREPFGGGPAPSDYLNGCRHVAATGAQFTVVIRDLASGHETLYPAPHPALPYPVSRLSWAPGGQRLLVSAGPSQDNEGWDLVEIDPATARSYLASTAPGGSAVPLTGPPGAARSYYREGVFLPDGDMFVNRVCCAGWPVRVTSSLLREIDPAGHLVRQVAIGFADRDHSSLGADPTGHWLLYLSGRDLFLSLDGAAPFKLTTGLIAAAWA